MDQSRYDAANMSLPFGNLPPHSPRQFVPVNLDLGSWEALEPLYQRLENEAALIHRIADFEQWLLRLSELEAAIAEEETRRYIAMTCQTDDASAEQAYLDFVENVEPRLKPRRFRLKQVFLAHPLRTQLPTPRYAVFARNVQVDVTLFQEQNVPLETEEAKLAQQYQKLSGSLTVFFENREQTLVQMGRYLEETDRSRRQHAWQLISERRLQEAEAFDSLFDNLLDLRSRIAANAGFKNYRDYAFRALHRFDYTPEDCERFHTAVGEAVMPLVRHLQSERQSRLQLDSLRPWDLAVDGHGMPPLHPFTRVDELVQNMEKIFDRVDPSGFGREFRELHRHGLLDLANRKGKAPGGYLSNLEEARLPFIFMNAVGTQRDVETLLHESGHAFHALACRNEPFLPYRQAPIEFCEVASMSMELIGNQFLDVFYPPEEARRARRNHLEGIAEIFAWIATIDAFQHWLYRHPNHSLEERRSAWLDLMNRFGGDINWSGLELAKANSWHKQLHVFIHPFYYIEYGIAQLGALQVWSQWQDEPHDALNRFRNALRRGGEPPLPELFDAAGCRLVFEVEGIRPIIARLQQELEALA